MCTTQKLSQEESDIQFKHGGAFDQYSDDSSDGEDNQQISSGIPNQNN